MKSQEKKGFLPVGLLLVSLLFDARVSLHTADAEPFGDPQSGKIIYGKNCALCHGQGGEGLGPQAILPNFSDPVYMAKKKDTEFFDKITRGETGTGMPSFGKVLSEQDRKNVVAYLRTLVPSGLNH